MDYDRDFSDEELARLRVLAEEELNIDDLHLGTTLENELEYVGRRLTTNSSVPGSIHRDRYYQFWEKELEAPEFVLDTLKRGYSLPFSSEPPPSFEKNNASALKDMTFVRAEVKRLEALGCIQKVKHRPRCVLPLSSVFSKKKRLVVDGSRCLNPFLLHRKIRLQDHRDVPDVVKPGSWFSTNDLDSGYWHIKINPDHWTYLGIHVVEEDGSVSFYVWKVLFLGISDAVFMFSCMLKPVRIYLAKRGVPILIYIDDVFVVGSNRLVCEANTALSLDVLKKAGWIVSPSKAAGPAPRITFLGLDICGQELKFFIPEAKLNKLVEILIETIKAKRRTARMMASLVGKIQSCYRALGPVTRFMTRRSYQWICQMVDSFSWDYWQNLTPEVIDELTFWKINLRSLSGYSFSPSLSQIDVKFEVASDASGVGVFGYLVGDKQVLLKRGFTLEEKKESSTYRELVALRDIYLSDFAVDLKGQVVRHLTDNKAVESIMRIGSSKPKLQDMAISIYKKSRDFNFTLLVEWRSREDPLIKFADEGSRLFDQSSYGLNFESFLYVINYFGHLQL